MLFVIVYAVLWVCIIIALVVAIVLVMLNYDGLGLFVSGFDENYKLFDVKVRINGCEEFFQKTISATIGLSFSSRGKVWGWGRSQIDR